MAFTIALVNSKGGVGKSTSAIAIAELFAREVGPTTLIDLDEVTGSATSWAAIAAAREQPLQARIETPPDGTPVTRLTRMLDQMTEGAEWVVIDSPPGDVDRSDIAVEYVARNGGLIVIPAKTTELDASRVLATAQWVGERATCYVLLTHTRAGTLSRGGIRAQIDAGAIPAKILTTEIPLRETIAAATVNLQPALDFYRPLVAELLTAAQEG